MQGSRALKERNKGIHRAVATGKARTERQADRSHLKRFGKEGKAGMIQKNIDHSTNVY